MLDLPEKVSGSIWTACCHRIDGYTTGACPQEVASHTSMASNVDYSMTSLGEIWVHLILRRLVLPVECNHCGQVPMDRASGEVQFVSPRRSSG